MLPLCIGTPRLLVFVALNYNKQYQIGDITNLVAYVHVLFLCQWVFISTILHAGKMMAMSPVLTLTCQCQQHSQNLLNSTGLVVIIAGAII